MRDYVLPRLARNGVDAVTTADVMAAPLPIWSTKRAIAGRVCQHIARVMKWALPQGYRDDNPAGDAISAATATGCDRHDGADCSGERPLREPRRPSTAWVRNIV